MNSNGRMWEWRDICMHTYTSSAHCSLLFCSSWSQQHTLFPPPVILIYICVCLCTYMCACLHLWGVKMFVKGRGALILVLMGWGGREVILKLYLWLESMLTMRKGIDKARRKCQCGAVRSADWLWLTALPHGSDILSLYVFCNISYLSLRAVTHTHTHMLG